MSARGLLADTGTPTASGFTRAFEDEAYDAPGLPGHLPQASHRIAARDAGALLGHLGLTEIETPDGAMVKLAQVLPTLAILSVRLDGAGAQVAGNLAFIARVGLNTGATHLRLRPN